MERKYYLRGLGIGIVVTAVIMGIALSGRHKMTDKEIIARAKELGMVEDTYLAEPDAGEEQMQGEQNIEDGNPGEQEEMPAAEPEPDSLPAEESLPEESESEESESLPIEVAEPVEVEPVEIEGPVQSEADGLQQDTNEMTRQEDNPSMQVKVQRVTIVSGDGSYSVALKLKEAGVVTSAETFDDYLCEKGYDKKLHTGTFQIPTDASDEQIARIITGQE